MDKDLCVLSNKGGEVRGRRIARRWAWLKPVGLACDANAAVCQANRGDAIAGKPAPTRIVSHANLMLAGIIVGAGLLAMQAARSGRQTAVMPSQASQPPQVLRRPLNPDLTGYDRQ